MTTSRAREELRPLRPVADLPAMLMDLVAQPVRLRVVARQTSTLPRRGALTNLRGRGHRLDRQQVVEREHPEHLPEVLIANSVCGAVGLPDPVERRRKRRWRVEVLGQRCEEPLTYRR